MNSEVHTPGPGDEHPGAAGALSRRAAEQGEASGLEATSPRPLDLDAIEAYLRDEAHVIDLREHGWTIKHTLTCRSIGLFDCEINQAAETDLTAPPPEVPGRYIVDLDGDGYLVIGERVTDHEETIDVPTLVRELRAARRFVERIRNGPGKGCACHGCIAKRNALWAYDQATKGVSDA